MTTMNGQIRRNAILGSIIMIAMLVASPFGAAELIGFEGFENIGGEIGIASTNLDPVAIAAQPQGNPQIYLGNPNAVFQTDTFNDYLFWSRFWEPSVQPIPRPLAGKGIISWRLKIPSRMGCRGTVL